MKICFADETVFTKNTLPRMAYATKGKNICVNMKDLQGVYRSALVAISTDGKVEHMKVTEKAINAKKYISFLTKLRKKLKKEKFCLFVDNLRVHKTVAVMKVYHDLKIIPIFNETYAPNYNPIETIFGQIKRAYKTQRLNKLVNGRIVNDDELIRQVFNQVKSEAILNAIRGSLSLLKAI